MSRRSTPTSSCPIRSSTLAQGRDRALGEIDVALLSADARGARPSITSFGSTRRGASCPRRRATSFCYGSGEEEIRFAYDDGFRAYDVKKPFEGVVVNLERRYLETDSEWAREEIGRYMSATPCAACEGFRLKPEALAVKIAGKHIGEVSELSVRARSTGSRALPDELDEKRNEIAVRILKEIRDRLTFLVDVGLDYLTLVARLGHAVGRREPAHPARVADRLGADRRALRARRAVDRPASARQ